MVDIIDKLVETDEIVETIQKAKCKNIRNRVFPKIYQKSLLKFENSDVNMVRSVAIYYSKGVMRGNKYRCTYKATSYNSKKGKTKASRITVAGCPIPKLIPYHRLIAFITSINIGILNSVYDTLCEGLDERDKVNGIYRNLEELLVSLASFYLNNDYDLLNFGDPDTFYVALGGDGAPCGKDDTAVA